ncbi:MAG: hypothetical protein DRN91_07115 [Candidatus Alkanophagales archaeon]|nr:MAG: hypothetical protein DRN91_07115 [Candidatus Alkanophagales archaeon]
MSFGEELSEKFKGVELCVSYILAHFPETRSNDKLLLLRYWEMVDKIKIPRAFWREFLRKATTPETITRARRRIQAEGEFLPRREVLERRQARSRKFREILKTGQSTLSSFK